jgi:glutathionylspermidine synthase
MRRLPVSPRANLAERCRETGFDFATIDGAVYWDERAYYAFTLRQIENHIEDPTTELSALCLDLVDRAMRDERILERLSIPSVVWDLIADSWRRRDPSLYGRFDLVYDGAGPARLLEYNADTPTALFEASVFQWHWLEDLRAARVLPDTADQFNAIHEALIATLTANKGPGPATLHLACDRHSVEDSGLIAYLADCAMQAGFTTTLLGIEDIGSRGRGPFVDLGGADIAVLFKLYPWEWMVTDAFIASPSMAHTRFIEPPWKAILSNKGILPLLWALHPGHPNLLECYFADDPAAARSADAHARKPLHSREGSNITLVRNGQVFARTGGVYADDAAVVQALAPLPSFDGNRPVIGSWIIGDKACGIGIREDAAPITQNTSRFVPHAIID